MRGEPREHVGFDEPGSVARTRDADRRALVSEAVRQACAERGVTLTRYTDLTPADLTPADLAPADLAPAALDPAAFDPAAFDPADLDRPHRPSN